MEQIKKFADAITVYLRINKDYRQASIRNPDRRALLKATRAEAFKLAQQANGDLHQYLNSIAEPGFVHTAAKALMQAWDLRNEHFEALAGQHGKIWHESPKEKIARLDAAERDVVRHLKAIYTIINHPDQQQ
ncbi:MAG: hypothetical protein KDD28_34830 [Phaeodactylibacter sp.]|nr:hypothetical protein [Phaeodactylibacter sp.]